MAVARYVQDTPLAAAASKGPCTQLADVVRMVRLSIASESSQTTSAAELGEIKLQITKMQKQLGAAHEVAMDELSSRALARSAPAAPPSWVRNPASGIAHAILVDRAPCIPDSACISRCGWKWAIARHEVLVNTFEDETPTRACKTCSNTAARDSSSGSSSEADLLPDSDD